MKTIDDGVKNRLIKFLRRDKVGLRKALLRLFSEKKSCNTVEIYNYLLKQGFGVNYRGVSAMVGQMHSRPVTRSYIMYCQCAIPSVRGNPTGMCVSGNTEVQSSQDNMEKFKRLI